MKKYKIKKKFFLLFEILIAVTLISICAVPLIRNPVYFYKKEMQTLEALSILKLESESIFEIKQMLLQNKISWDSFSNKNRLESAIEELPSKQLIIKGFKDKKIPIYYRIWTKNEKPCKNNTIARVIFIEISINKILKTDKPKKIHKVFVKKVTSSSLII